MWAHACELAERADRMHRQFFRLARDAEALWEPPADVFEEGRDLLIVVALPGVADGDVTIATDGGALVVRAHRPLPFAGTRLAVRQLEIPYGFFERRIALPRANLELVTRELRYGCLFLRLRRID
jgi:HSP20 family molecular chaperone IbpA